ncbi:MAG TPA: HupE/UreJ family protein [Polyangiaceae bacterium]
MKRAFIAWCVCVLGLVWAGDALAHKLGLSQGEYRRTEHGLSAELTFARSEIAALLRSRTGAQPELTSEHAALRDRVVRRIHVSSAQGSCAGALERVTPIEGDGLKLSARYACADPDRTLRVRLDVLQDLAHGHRHAARIVSASYLANGLYFGTHAAWEVPPLAASEPADRPGSLGGFVTLGIEHILTGYDHVLFLFALLIVGGRTSALLKLVTAFTLAHSLTLAATALGLVAPDPGFVEPAIALSVAYVGLENFFVRDADRRWRIAFLFGLVHGFGFAGVLGEIALPRAELLPALLAFNLGVELGQLALIALALPLLAWLRGRAWFTLRVVPVLSSLVIVVGLAWFAERVHAEFLESSRTAVRVTRRG